MLRAHSTAARLVLNGALLILAGYLCGAAIPHVIDVQRAPLPLLG